MEEKRKWLIRVVPNVPNFEVVATSSEAFRLIEALAQAHSSMRVEMVDVETEEVINSLIGY